MTRAPHLDKKYKFIKRIEGLPFVEKIILFGSRARGDHAKRADIDLAIGCSGATDKEWMEVQNIIDEADTLLKIDCVRLGKLPPNSELKNNIIREGIVLYEKVRT